MDASGLTRPCTSMWGWNGLGDGTDSLQGRIGHWGRQILRSRVACSCRSQRCRGWGRIRGVLRPLEACAWWCQRRRRLHSLNRSFCCLVIQVPWIRGCLRSVRAIWRRIVHIWRRGRNRLLWRLRHQIRRRLKCCLNSGRLKKKSFFLPGFKSLCTILLQCMYSIAENMHLII